MKRNIWPFGAGQPLGSRSTVYHVKRTRASAGRSPQMSAREVKERERERMARKLDDPDLNRKLKAHYARGGSLHEFLTANPSARGRFAQNAEIRLYHGHTIWPVPGGWQTSLNSLATFPSEAAVKKFIDGWFKQNPGGTEGEFQRCVDAVAAKGGAYDPRAVCASMERRKYGFAELQRRAKAGKRKAAKARGNPSSRDVAAAKKMGADAFSRGLKRAPGGDRKLMSALSAMERMMQAQTSGPLKFGWSNPFLEAWLQGWDAANLRHNPASEAAAVYEEFHGGPSTRVTEVTERVHSHRNLAELGELRKIVVDGVDGYRHRLVGFGDALLCSNEKKNQLFIRGGDQAIDLKAEFHIDSPHEIETLGEVQEIFYFTTKTHLGEEGGMAIYFHKAGTTVTDSGKHRKVGYGPQLIYRTRDKALEFAGGTYEIKAEGIDK